MVGSPVLFGAPEVYRHVFPKVLLDGDFGGRAINLFRGNQGVYCRNSPVQVI